MYNPWPKHSILKPSFDDYRSILNHSHKLLLCTAYILILKSKQHQTKSLYTHVKDNSCVLMSYFALCTTLHWDKKVGRPFTSTSASIQSTELNTWIEWGMCLWESPTVRACAGDSLPQKEQRSEKLINLATQGTAPATLPVNAPLMKFKKNC